MQFLKALRRCKHKYIICYKSERLVILACTKCGTTKPLWLADEKKWMKDFDDAMNGLIEEKKSFSERLLDNYDWCVEKYYEFVERFNKSRVANLWRRLRRGKRNDI
jgi:hypothetical protein